MTLELTLPQRLLRAFLSGASDEIFRRLKERFPKAEELPGSDAATKGCLKVLYSGGLCDVNAFDLRTGGMYHDSIGNLGLAGRGDAGGTRTRLSPDEANSEAEKLISEMAREADRQTLMVSVGKAMADLTTGVGEPALVASELREATSLIRSPKAPPSLDEYVTATQLEMARILEHGVELTTGVGEFDARFTFRRSNLVTVGAFTSHGKTAFATMATAQALRAGRSVAYLCFEDYGTWLLKFACQISGHPLRHFTNDYGKDRSAMARADGAVELARQFRGLLVYPPMRLGEFEAELSRLKKPPDLLILDYCQKYVECYGGDDRRVAASKVTSDFQDLIRKYNAFGIMTSQLSRPESAPNGRRMRRPELRLLKESGDIENYSDAVLLLYWPWRDSMDGADLEKDKYEITIAKNKLGECRRIECLFDGATLSFKDRFQAVRE